MIRTIIWFIWFVLSLLISLPFSLRVKYLIKKNKIEESEALIYKCTNIWAKSLLKLAGVKLMFMALKIFLKIKLYYL